MKLNWNHPILVSSHEVTNCTDTLLLGMLLRTIVEKEVTAEEGEWCIYWWWLQKRGRPSFYPSVGGGGWLHWAALLFRIISNLRLGPGHLFILLYRELFLESRDSSCIEKNQLSFSNYTALHTALSVEKQIPLPMKQGFKLLFGLTYWCWNQMADKGAVQEVKKQSKEWNLKEKDMRSYADLKKLQSYKES